jgi:predicted nucleotidyltransferase component of viral defense system
MVPGRSIVYRFESEISPITPMRLKIEINTREHFSVLGFVKKPFQVESSWFSGNTNITTYALEELLGTKLRALYQRKKGRDLFDLAYAFKHFPTLDAQKIVMCFNTYLAKENNHVSRSLFEACMASKLEDVAFLEDVLQLLPDNKLQDYQPHLEMKKLLALLISKLT